MIWKNHYALKIFIYEKFKYFKKFIRILTINQTFFAHAWWVLCAKICETVWGSFEFRHFAIFFIFYFAGRDVLARNASQAVIGAPHEVVFYHSCLALSGFLSGWNHIECLASILPSYTKNSTWSGFSSWLLGNKAEVE